MHQQKRFGAAAIALALILSLFSGCSRAPDENETAMLNAWHSCLQAHEETFHAMFWAYDYADAFCRDNQWDSLQKARCTANAALLSLQTLSLPENSLTQEQRAALLKRDIEVDVVTTELETLKTTLQYRTDTMTLLATHLNHDVYLNSNMDTVRPWLQSSQTYSRLEMEYLWLTTNYLLIQLNRQDLWEQWQTDFPTLAACATQWEEDPEVLMDRTDSLMDKLAEEIVLIEGYSGTSQYALDMVRQAIETGDLTALGADINWLEGVPGYFPAPVWLPEELPFYSYMDEETLDVWLPTPGENVTDPPSSCYISCTGVLLEEAEHYADLLTLLGLEPWTAFDEATGIYQMLVTSGNANLTIRWTEEKTEVYLHDSPGCLIPELYLLTMLEN